MLHFNVFTLFPDLFPGPLGQSVVGNAIGKQWDLKIVPMRNFAQDKHQTVDAPPFGGGAGMVMRPDVIDAALLSVPESQRGQLIYLSPKGCPLDQAMVRKLSESSNLSLLCGRYEGIDERIFDTWDVLEISVGDFVLSGGELAAMCLIDACVRVLPGVLGNDVSSKDESFENFLLEHPHYTKPRLWNGMDVPEVLVSGHHEKIKSWRLEQSKRLTKERRPDLWKKYVDNS